jgi:hypothetical protein
MTENSDISPPVSDALTSIIKLLKSVVLAAAHRNNENFDQIPIF